MHEADDSSAMHEADDLSADGFFKMFMRAAEAALPPPTPAEVVRRIRAQLAAAPGRWHRCPRRLCRRHRCCGSPDLDCVLVVLPAEEQAETLARINRALAAHDAKRAS